METDVRPITAGGNTPGWVNGSAANMPPSGSITCLFDLGPEWDQYNLINLCVNPVGPSTGFSNVAASGSDTTTANTARRLGFYSFGAANSSLTASITTAGGPQNLLLNPMGRYVHVQLTNADAANAMGAATKVTLTAFSK